MDYNSAKREATLSYPLSIEQCSVLKHGGSPVWNL